MNKETAQVTGFMKKPYAQPRIWVVEIKSADLICTSGASTQSLDEEDYIWP